MIGKIISKEEYTFYLAMGMCKTDDYYYCERCDHYILSSWSPKCLCEEG
jgi:hypothetical protein